MEPRPEDQLFEDFRRTGDPAPLAEVFDRTAPELLRIALHLTPDAGRAEDLVQETFVSAIESAGSFDTSRRLLPWLAGILTNRARELRRREERAVDAARVSRPAVEDPLRDAQEGELSGRLDEAIRTLPEPYQPVLVLYLRHGLDSAQIAEALRRPGGTVRSQLVRGLEKLRKALPAGLALSALAGITTSRGLAAVRQQVLASVAGAATPSGLVSLAGAGGLFVMKKALFASAAVLLLGVVCWISWPDDPGRSQTGDVATERAPATALAAPTLEPATRPEEARTRVAVTSYGMPARGSLLVRARWGNDGASAEGISLVATPVDASPSGLHDRIAVTSADGTALLEDLPAGKVAVVLDRGGRGEATIEEQARTELVIDIPRGVDVRGSVVREPDLPVSGARVWVSLERRDDQGQFAGASAEDGTFLLRSVQPGRSVSVFVAGFRPPPMQDVKGNIGETVSMRFVLEHPGGTLEGRVADVAGTPVAGATLMIGKTPIPMFDHGIFPAAPAIWLRSGEHGEFVTASVPVGVLVPVHARAPGFAPWRGEVQLVEGERKSLEIRLAAGATLTGRVLDAERKPCAGVFVSAGTVALQVPLWSYATARTAADGSYRLDGVAPGTFQARAQRPNERGVQAELSAMDGQVVEWSPVLGSVMQIVGRVVDERREPLERWTVAAFPPGDSLVSKQARTDAVGRFVVEDCDAGPYRLEIGGPDGQGIVPALVIDAIRPAEEEVLVVVPDARRPSAVVCGQLVGPDGRPAGRVQVMVWNEINKLGMTMASAPGSAEAESGRFETKPLPPGRYRLHVQPGWYTSPPIELRCELLPGQRLDLGVIRLEPPGTFSVVARRADGSPLTTSGFSQVCASDGTVITQIMIGGAMGPHPWNPGSYLLRVWDREAPLLETAFDVVSGRDTKVEVVAGPGVVRRVVFSEKPLASASLTSIDWEDLDRGLKWKDELVGFKGTLERAFAPGRYSVRAETTLGTRAEGFFEVGAGPAPEPIRVLLR